MTDFRILGPLEVQDCGERVSIGTGKQRALLALLLLQGNDVVSVDRLIEGLWDGDAPASARKAIQVYVSRLRKALGAERIRTSGPGYLLELGQDELDLHRFERLVEEARELRARDEPALASGALREALALWHGSPLADLAEEPFSEPEIARLEGLRLAAIEERVDLDLALGRGADLVPELERLVAQNLYRERLRGQLMLALYRAGRQADALAAYQQARQLFVDELGIEPSPALQRLEQAILRQESGLEALLEAVEEDAEPQEEEPAQTPPAIRRSRLRRPLIAVVGLVLAGVVATGAVVRATRPHYLHGVEANKVGVINAKAAGIEKQLPLNEGTPNGIASDGRNVWIAQANGRVSRYAPDVPPLANSVGVSADGVAYDPTGYLWVTTSQTRTVTQLDANGLEPVQAITVGNGPRAIAADKQAVWVANTIDGTISRIDLDRGAPVPREPTPVAPGLAGIAIGGGGVWVTSEETGDVFRLDPKSSRVIEPIHSGNGAGGIAYGDGAVWVANRDDDTVSRIDPDRNEVTDTIRGFDKPEAVESGGGSIWVANAGDATIKRIDPRGQPRIDATVRLGSLATGLAFAGNKLWVTTVGNGEHRGGILQVEFVPPPDWCRCVDPVDGPTELTQLVYDGLVAYRRVGGTRGETLVPDLAERIPNPTPDGKTYTFQLRRGLRYSNGVPVRASDFRRSLERRLRLDKFRPAFYGSILGAEACTELRCDLSRGIEVDGARTIVIRLRAADPELLHKLALPGASVVPSRTPVSGERRHPIPSIGPYRVASITAHRVRLVRNERFHPWATDARPDGYPEEIRFRLGNDAKDQLAAVKQGASDWVAVGHLGPAETRGLKTRYARRLYINPVSSWSYWFFMNTRVRPFNSVRVRKAVNYAIDRRRLIELSGEQMVPSCQILPPVLPGYQPYCPYTRDPSPAGTWTAPDLAKARKLVKASGTAGMHVEVDAVNTRPGTAEYVASVLRRLGYPASVRQFDPSQYYSYVGDSRNRAQIGPAGWVPDYLVASNFLDLFKCKTFVPRSDWENLNLFEFCDSALDAEMKQAQAVQGSDSSRAAELYSDVDRKLVDRAVAVPFGSPRKEVLVSERVGNFQAHPLWGTLLDQLWVR